MTIPLWTWPVLCVLLLLAVGEYDAWRINRRRDNFRAVEAERQARLNAAPLGNVSRFVEWDFDREDAA